MSDPAPKKITRLGELPRDIQPPRDGWPALEARLRSADSRRDGERAADSRANEPQELAGPILRGGRRSVGRRSVLWLGAVAAGVVAVVAGILVDRLILQDGHPGAERQLLVRRAAPGTSPREPAGAASRLPSAALPATFIRDPHYLAERAALLASLDERLKSLPPQTRQQVLASLATIHRSMQQIEQALGREPTNALLQGLLIDTYQDEMNVLTAVQEAGAGSGES